MTNSALSIAEPAVNPFLTTTDYTMADVEEALDRIDRDDPVNALISVFYLTTDPACKFGSPFVRKAAQQVIAQFGPDGAFNLAKAAVAFRHQPYFPSVTSVQELAKKMAKVSAAVSRISAAGSGRKVLSV